MGKRSPGGREDEYKWGQKVKLKPHCSSLSYLPTPSDNFIVDVSDHHPVDDRDPEKPGENPLQDVKAHVRAARTQNKGLLWFQDTKDILKFIKRFIRQDR